MFDAQNDDFWTQYEIAARQLLSPMPGIRRAAHGEIRAMNLDVREHNITRNGVKPELVIA